VTWADVRHRFRCRAHHYPSATHDRGVPRADPRGVNADDALLTVDCGHTRRSER
jgi:hypothetical protein